MNSLLVVLVLLLVSGVIDMVAFCLLLLWLVLRHRDYVGLSIAGAILLMMFVEPLGCVHCCLLSDDASFVEYYFVNPLFKFVQIFVLSFAHGFVPLERFPFDTLAKAI